MDSDDTGLDRLSGDAAPYRNDAQYPSDSVIQADIAWRGSRPAAAKPAVIGVALPRRAPVGAESIEDVIIGSSAQAKAVREAVRVYAEFDAPVLIIGETGVGKELVARELHRLSLRRSGPFYPINAGAVPETLAAAEFFGHTKGAFTGAIAERDGAFLAADGGVLFLDELGEMPLSIQGQLLRVLDDGMATRIGARAAVKVDFRLIAATNVALSRSVEAGAFRRDLFYRVNVLTIEVPPLRVRGDDAIEIAERMIAAHADERLRKAKLTPSAADRLRAHRFPGNVRELRNLLTRALIGARGGKIFAEHIEVPAARGGDGAGLATVAGAKKLLGRVLMLRALREADGNVTKAAASIGLSRTALHALMKDFDGANLVAELETASSELRALLDE